MWKIALSCNIEESLKKFLDPDRDANDYQNLTETEFVQKIVLISEFLRAVRNSQRDKRRLKRADYCIFCFCFHFRVKVGKIMKMTMNGIISAMTLFFGSNLPDYGVGRHLKHLFPKLQICFGFKYRRWLGRRGC